MADEPKPPLTEAEQNTQIQEEAVPTDNTDTPTQSDDAAKVVEPTHADSWRDTTDQTDQTEPVVQADAIAPAGRFHRLKKIRRAYWRKKKWTVPLTFIMFVALLLGVPFTRYVVLATVLKKDAAIVVTDSSTNQAVTDATVSVDGKTLKTDNHGRVMANLKVGKHPVTITKKYYKTYSSSVFVGITKPASLKVSAVATGRQVPITVSDFVTGRPLENAVIAASGSSAKTDKKGKATLVLPADDTMAKASITRSGYNDTAANVQITSREVNTNRFTATPSGKVYFLSNLSGKIDVVKTDLDGKNRKTVLAGTGSEDTYSTSLLASRDWKHLALLSKRDGKPGIYLIDGLTDKTVNIDGGSANVDFSLVGWSGSTFVYQVNRSNVSNWQSGAQVIKSYDAANNKLYTIDQSQGEGTGTYDYGFTNYSTVSLLEGEIVFAKNWYSSQLPDHLTGKSSSLISARPDGSGKKTIKDFPVPSGTTYGYSISTLQYEAYGIYVQVPVGGNSSTNNYYEYEDGSLAAKTDVTDDTWNKPYPTFLISPSGKQTFWSDVRDNKNTLFVGNDKGANGKQIAALSSYTPYGWYSDNYLLVTKNGSELYIMPTDGSKDPSKLTDYYKPQLSYRGYGGGYGGI